MNEQPKSTRPNSQLGTVALKNMFSGVARRYDLANRVLSLGRDTFWRQALARRIKVLDCPGRLLDLAAGTGDQIIAIKKFWPQLKIVGIDLSATMMDLAWPKFIRLSPPIPEMVVGDALELPFEADSFDSVSISFGLRNIPSRREIFREVLRVLKPGGRFLVLEMFHDRQALLAPVARFYLEKVVPVLGGRIISREYEAYSYLTSSVLAFPQPEALVSELEVAGFCRRGWRSYTLGTVMLVWGEKKESDSFGAKYEVKLEK